MAGPRDYSTATRAALATLSRARCYFPDCNVQVLRFIDGEPYIDYQIAHIRDAKPGNRYAAHMSEDERREFSNLILLCKPHHELVDKRHPARFTVEDLEAWKHAREGDAAKRLSEVGPVTEDMLADLLTRSVAEEQMEITNSLRGQDDVLRRRIQAVLADASFERVCDALTVADQRSLLSPLGVRSAALLTEFYLRIQKTGDSLRVHLDTRWIASVFSDSWLPGQGFSEVMLRLAHKARPTPYWPGTELWEFASALEGIVDVLVSALDWKAGGAAVSNAVQLVGTNWLLSDWDAVEVPHFYQITYARLDENDWYSHLANKPWAESHEVAEMLDQGKFLRDLAARAEQ